MPNTHFEDLVVVLSTKEWWETPLLLDPSLHGRQTWLQIIFTVGERQAMTALADLRLFWEGIKKKGDMNNFDNDDLDIADLASESDNESQLTTSTWEKSPSEDEAE